LYVSYRSSSEVAKEDPSGRRMPIFHVYISPGNT